MWLDSDGLPETYNSQATVGLIKTILMRGFFSTTLSSITITTEGTIYTSTATTAVPVNISHDGMSLMCTDNSTFTNISINIIKSKYTHAI